MKSQTMKFGTLFLTTFLVTFSACKTDQTTFAEHNDARRLGHSAATIWIAEYRDLVKKSTGWTPPVAARAFGYAGVALYESVAPGNASQQSLAGQLDQMPAMPSIDENAEYHWGLSANACMAALAKRLFGNATPAQISEIEALESKLNVDLRGDLDQAVFDRSSNFGREVAAKIADWAESDGGHMGFMRNFPTDYAAPTGAGKWAPTAPAFKPAMQPYWGQNRSIVPNSAAESQPPAPQTFSTERTSRFYQQALEVYSLGKNLSVADRKTAHFWSDEAGLSDTPSGHLMAITEQVCRASNASLARTAEAFARAGMAVNDAFVASWKCKFEFNQLRPITYIRAEIDAGWSPLLATPPSPEFSSEQSTQAGAWAQAMSDFFGHNYPFVDETHKDRTDIDGSPRAYASFFKAADEAAISQMLGGVQFRESNEIGLEMGKKIGRKVSAIRFSK